MPVTPFEEYRITPACAGNTFRGGFVHGRYKDHPRMCGEYSSGLPMPPPMIGSPPHVRGIPKEVLEKLKMDRITPACAGNTVTYQKKTILCEDHPRMCGEYIRKPS